MDGHRILAGLSWLEKVHKVEAEWTVVAYLAGLYWLNKGRQLNPRKLPPENCDNFAFRSPTPLGTFPLDPWFSLTARRKTSKRSDHLVFSCFEKKNQQKKRSSSPG